MSFSVLVRDRPLTACESCGHATRNGILITVGGVTHYFDSFQCAIHCMAAECEHCGCRILGRPLEAQQRLFCSQECLSAMRGQVLRVYPIHLRNT